MARKGVCIASLLATVVIDCIVVIVLRFSILIFRFSILFNLLHGEPIATDGLATTFTRLQRRTIARLCDILIFALGLLLIILALVDFLVILNVLFERCCGRC